MNNYEKEYNKAYALYLNCAYKEAYTLFLKLAEKEDISSQVSIATMLIKGEGIPQNKIEGYKWYKKAADLGNSYAQYMYAMYAIFNNNIDEGLLYLNNSFKQDDPNAIIEIALFKVNKQYGFLKNDQESILLLERSLILETSSEVSRILLTLHYKKYGTIKTIFYFIKNFKKLNLDIRFAETGH